MYKIIQTDAESFLKNIPSNSVNCVFIDPPYNQGLQYPEYNDALEPTVYLRKLNNVFYHIERVLMPGGAFWLVISDEYAAELNLACKRLKFIQRNWIIWSYTFGVHCVTKFSRCHAHLFYFIKPGPHVWNRPLVESTRLKIGDKRAVKDGKTPGDVWDDFPRIPGNDKERFDYPCQLPVGLVERAILCSTNEGDLVIDTYLGTGTTAVVCKKHNRKFAGCDISEKAIQITRGRL